MSWLVAMQPRRTGLTSCPIYQEPCHTPHGSSEVKKAFEEKLQGLVRLRCVHCCLWLHMQEVELRSEGWLAWHGWGKQCKTC